MEVIGTGTNHNPDGDAGVEVYRPKAGATTDVYTFHPTQTVEASGEPRGTATGPATWTRWTAGLGAPVDESGMPLGPKPELVTPAPLAVSDPGLADSIDAAIIDLATTLGVDSSGNVGIRSASSITWSDTALGCPQPGYAYAQVVTPGFLVVLVYQDQDREYRYHSDLDGPPFLCETSVREAMPDPEYREQEAER